MNFEKVCILTKVEEKERKDGSTYYVLTVLDLDSGQTSACMYRSSDLEVLKTLKPMSKYHFTFLADFGKYPGLRVLGIKTN